MCRVHVLALEVLVLLLYALNQPSHCTASGWFGGDNAPAAEPVGCSPASGDSCRSAPGDSGEFNPYSIIGVPTDASEEVIVKAYRKLARRWHPDRNRGSEEAQAVFATIAQAYDVLTDTEKREIYDRLGERGLERLRDGDPSVKKDWLPPDEVLRRIHNDGDEPWHREFCFCLHGRSRFQIVLIAELAIAEWLVTSTFASLSSLIVPARDQLRWLPIFLGLETEFPWVGITATDSTGQSIATGATTNIGVTFKFQLSGKR